MKIVVLDGDRENPGDLSWEGLAALGDLTVYDKKPANETETIDRIGDGDIILTNKTPITEAVLKACPNLKYIGVLATGYNVVDCEAAKKKNIPVTNIPAYGTMAVAQYTIAMLLEICHRVGHHAHEVAQGRWQNEDWCFWDHPLMELDGKTMGIIGFGRIGRQTGRIARALGMNVLAYNRSECEEGRAIGDYVTLEELLERSDVISLHCPLFPETEGIIDRNAIARMKDGVILLNTARGPLIAEQDLADALERDKVYAAAVDVVSEEPIKPDNPLLKAKNCFITPHIAWASKESRQRIMDCAVKNLKAFLAGTPVNVVNL